MQAVDIVTSRSGRLSIVPPLKQFKNRIFSMAMGGCMKYHVFKSSYAERFCLPDALINF